MTSFSNIQVKLGQFVKKYYKNELLKGAILFTAFGMLYFLITLFIEYFLWLDPLWRSLLFFAFLLVELALLVRFIVLPLSKLMGLRKGITHTDASRIIGKHFPEVDDKLLNLLQLDKAEDRSELFLASIEQKSQQLQPIPFQVAIDFSSNKKYLKYLAIPFLIWLFTLVSGNNGIFKDSFDRVVHYNTEYSPPAPFSFKILNTNFDVIEGNNFDLRVETQGDIAPESAKIQFNGATYFLKNEGLGAFSFQFENLNSSIEFYLESNGIRSSNFRINTIKTPAITGLRMALSFPKYTSKRNQTIQNSGNARVPEGTRITWFIETKATDSVHFIDRSTTAFESLEPSKFTHTRRLRNSLNYVISTSNEKLSNFEQLTYSIDVTKDEYPKINVQSDMDSVSRGPVQFYGQLSDDYGVSKLELVYYDLENKEQIKRKSIEVKKVTYDEFYYLLIPDGELELQAGKDYEFYFEVFDNDGVNGAKSAKSELFKYHSKTKQEISDSLLKEQKESLDNLDKNAKRTDELNKDFENLTDKLKKKSDIEWNDKKEIEQFLKRQENYQEMFEKQTDQLRENLDQLTENDETLRDKKETLQKRIEETKELTQKEKLLEELKKMSEKLDREGLIDKLDKLTERQKQEKRSLERLLEMVKRFYVEKKAMDISNKLDSLANDEMKLSESEENSVKKQEELNRAFDSIQKDLNEMRKENQKLRKPMDLPNTKQEEKIVDERLEEATDELRKEDGATEDQEAKEGDKQKNSEENSPEGEQEGEQEGGNEQQESESNEKSDSKENMEQSRSTKKARQLQRSASRKMKQMSQSMQQSMSGMQGEMMQEDIEALRAILENLVSFSLDQEALMVSLKNVDAAHASFPKKLKKQQLLKEHFEHIDDSLYVLSMRQPRVSSKIQEDLTEAHYNIDKSLDNIAENRMQQGRSNQQYTMTAVNNLADMLSDMLESMMNPSMGSGGGSGQSSGQKNQFGLPDVIQKQKGLTNQMKESIEQQGSGKSKEQMSGEQYQIYQEQQQLRQQLEEMMGGEGEKGSKGNKALEKMKELEQQLLDKGFTDEVMQNMIRLEHELLKLDEAKLKQGKDSKRESTTNYKSFTKRQIEQLLKQQQYLNINEVLNRDPLPLRTNYKKKVQDYFKGLND